MSEVAIHYPSEYESEVVLRDGSTVLLRPIRPGDAEAWMEFVRRLSQHTKYLRFFQVPKDMTWDDAVRYCTVDYDSTFAVVGEVTEAGAKRMVAVGRYYRLADPRSAEMAVVVEDIYQHRGLGTPLMKRLAQAAHDRDIATFEADVLEDNADMMTFLKDSGFHLTSRVEGGVAHVVFPIGEVVDDAGAGGR